MTFHYSDFIHSGLFTYLVVVFRLERIGVFFHGMNLLKSEASRAEVSLVSPVTFHILDMSLRVHT